ncbi:hypothetical protein T459_20226 [Capsicum annuum]|uniref:Retrovirus-related Pol polyprotein from transposon TNT 1-94 n=1 Tax=Capsicum annuum TaxID=4072 RepID=A0A2G2Z425_CAPAN|nr:hypothetical protein T459_20226 [Capsicum annuum]
MTSSNSSFWKVAVNSEIDSILSNNIWELVDVSPGNKPLGSKWIFKSIAKTPLDASFALQKNEGYSDANWITGSNEVKSTSGYVFTIGGRAVFWKSSKQTCIACSTMEYEFIALDKAGEEAEWLRNFLEDIPYWPKPVALVCIHCDSQAVIGRAERMMYNCKSHHIRQRYNTIRELLSSGIITVDYVKSKDNVSDPPTKGLSIEGVERNPRKWI